MANLHSFMTEASGNEARDSKPSCLSQGQSPRQMLLCGTEAVNTSFLNSYLLSVLQMKVPLAQNLEALRAHELYGLLSSDGHPGGLRTVLQPC